MENMTRRRLLGNLLAAAAVTGAAGLPSKTVMAQGLDFFTGLIYEPLGFIETIFSIGNDAAAEHKSEKIKEIATLSQDLVVNQQKILDGVKGLAAVFHREVSQAFQNDLYRELTAELASFRIMVADGKPPESGAYLSAKAERLERLGYEVARRYGSGGYPAFMSAMGVSYILQNMDGASPVQMASQIQQHSEIIDSWLRDTSAGSPVQLLADSDLIQNRAAAIFSDGYQLIPVGEVARSVAGHVLVDKLSLEIIKSSEGVLDIHPLVTTAATHYRPDAVPERYRLPDGQARLFMDGSPALLSKYYDCLEPSAPQEFRQDRIEERRSSALAARESCVQAFATVYQGNRSEYVQAHERLAAFVASMTSARDTLTQRAMKVRAPEVFSKPNRSPT